MKTVKGKNVQPPKPTLISELSQLIEQSQQKVMSNANSTIVLLFWHIGTRIYNEILQNKRADYGKQIAAKTFERTTIANVQNISNNPAIHNNFKDPYFFDFLGLKNAYLENDIEVAILRELEAFVLELGTGFAFVEHPKKVYSFSSLFVSNTIYQ